MAHNEKLFLPIWLKYYSRYFDSNDIYVINHDSTDGSIQKAQEDYRFNLVDVHTNTIYDNNFMRNTVQDFQHKLLKKYKVVAYSDTDELLIIDPDLGIDLGEYIDNYNGLLGCNTRSVVEQSHELPYDSDIPVLKQRSVWFEEYLYNKVLVSKTPLYWSKGLHALQDKDGVPYTVPIDENLILLHLARLDLSERLKRNKENIKETWGGENDDAKQQRLSTKELKYWFYNPVNLGYIGIIPERFKELV